MKTSHEEVYHTLPELEAACAEAKRHWRELLRQPDCWTIPAKRFALSIARQDYQDAALAFVAARAKQADTT